MQMRDRPDGMARNSKEKIMSLDQLMRGDPRIGPHWIEVPVINDIMSSRGGDSSYG